MSPAIACANCSEPIAPGARFCSRCGYDVSGPQGNLTTNQLPPTGTSRDSGIQILEHLRRATLGEYDIVGELGRGGMAIVFLAHDIALDRKVAIKVMNPGLMMGAGMLERFKREARTAAALTHPNIIPIHLVRETEELLFFVMKYVEGRGLDSIITETGTLPIRMVLTILAQVGTALGYAHRRGVVHRDIKPANILIDTEGWIVVTDFGIAKVAEAGALTVSGMTVGTPRYMSPEQCTARPVTGASDQYSLGIVGFEMITGQPPFGGDSLMEIMRMHFFEPPPPIRNLRPECPPALTAAIERMLAKEPGQRWPSVEDAIAATGDALMERDDSIRSHMIDLAKTGIKPVARMSTPVSPTPLGRNSPPAASAPIADTAPRAQPISPTQPHAESLAHHQAPRRRAFIWGMVGLAAVAISVGIYLRAQPAPASVASIEMAGLPAAVEEGQQVRLNARVKNLEGATISTPVRWSSNDTTVAQVSKDGLLTGVAAGTATIDASSGNQHQSAGITVKLAAAASIEVLPSSVTLSKGATRQLTPVVKDARGASLAGRTVRWSSQDRAVATVAESGLVTGVAPGATTVDASSESGHASVRVTVTPAPLASLTIEPASVVIQVGDTQKLTATPKDASGQRLDGHQVDWSSSAPSVASVSAGGVVVGLTPGAADVSARSGESNASRRVTVRPPAVASIAISPLSGSIPVRGTIRLTAVAQDARARPLPRRPIAWSTGDPAIASVSQNGLVTGIGPGVVPIEASSEGIRGRAMISVTAPSPGLPPTVASVTLSPAAPTVTVGDSVQLTAAAKSSGGQALNALHLTWASSDSTIASISSRGLVTALAPGSARITATTANGSSGSAQFTVTRQAASVLTVILPYWANGSIDGRSWGQRTRFQASVPAGTPHTLRFERPGYVTVDTTVTLQPGDSVALRISMKAAAAGAAPPVLLRIQIRPSWAAVSIDGRSVGQQRDWTDSLAPGPHRLRFERVGYMTVDTTVTLQPAETHPVLRINMQRGNP